MSYSVLDIANYIVSKGSINTIRLYRILYVAQFTCCKSCNSPLFSEPFILFKNGPICESIQNLCNDSFVVTKELFKNNTYAQIDETTRNLLDVIYNFSASIPNNELKTIVMNNPLYLNFKESNAISITADDIILYINNDTNN